MLQIPQTAGAVVAADSKDAVSAFDQALLSSMRMCMSFIEASHGTNLPANRSQKVLDTLAAGISGTVNARADIVGAIRHLVAMKRDSNIAPVDFGCPEGWESLGMPETGVRTESVTA